MGYKREEKQEMLKSIFNKIKSYHFRFIEGYAAVSNFIKKTMANLPFIGRRATLLRTGIAALLLLALFLFLVSDAIPGISDSSSGDTASLSASSGKSSSDLISSPLIESDGESSSPFSTTASSVSPATTQAPGSTPTVTPSATPAPVSMGVAIPANLTPGIPSGILAVPAGQKAEWMTYLSLFPASTRCAMYLYINPAVASVQETAGRIVAAPPAGSGNTAKIGAGLLIAFQTDRNDYKAELLSVDLESTGTQWRIVPVRNPAAAALGGTVSQRNTEGTVPLFAEKPSQ